jgi:hypothetical protein
MEKVSKYQAVCSAIEQANGNPISIAGICKITNLSTKAVRIAIDYLEESGHIKAIEMKPKSYFIIKKCNENSFLRQGADKQNNSNEKKCKCADNQDNKSYLPLFAPICPTDYQALNHLFAPICPYLPLNGFQQKLSTGEFAPICPYLPLFAPLIINQLASICPYLPLFAPNDVKNKGKYQNFRYDNQKNNSVTDTLSKPKFERNPKKPRNWQKISNFYASKSNSCTNCSQPSNLFDEKLAYEVCFKYIPLISNIIYYSLQNFQNFSEQYKSQVINNGKDNIPQQKKEGLNEEKLTKEKEDLKDKNIPQTIKDNIPPPPEPKTQKLNFTLEAEKNPTGSPVSPDPAIAVPPATGTTTTSPIEPETQTPTGNSPAGHPTNSSVDTKKSNKVAYNGKKELPACLSTFEAYKDDLRKFYDEIRRKEPKAVKLMDDMTNRYNNLDFMKTLDMNCKDYWGTEEGYKQKLKAFKTSKSENYEIDWYKTFTNSLKFASNRLYKNFKQEDYKGLPHGYMDLNAR